VAKSDKTDQVDLSAPVQELRAALAEASVIFKLDNRAGAMRALQGIGQFLNGIDVSTEDAWPVLEIGRAFIEIDQGIRNPLIMPEKLKGRPQRDLMTLVSRGRAAAAMELFMKAGMTKKDAAVRVAYRLHGTALITRLEDQWEEVKRWRDEATSGSPEEIIVSQYRKALVAHKGSDLKPEAAAEAFLQLIRLQQPL
jgi:hypothetical protein